MRFNTAGLSGNQKEITELFLKAQGFELDFGGVKMRMHIAEGEGVKAEFDEEQLILYGSREVHCYRALHLFMQEVKSGRSGAFVRQESVSFKDAGIMLDCSRNGTVDKPMIEEIIRLCAASGINQLYLYMEDVYEIAEDAYFGAYRGRYTSEDLKELDGYGRKMGVELIPTIQTLAHLYTYLRWPVTRTMQDTPDILLVDSKETEVFVRRMIQAVSAAFSSRRIHVGMDEADMLGLGKYLRKNGYEERYQIMTRHLQMVQRICREEGLEAMIWSDMFFRLMSPTGGYYDLEADADFKLEESLPEDLTLVYWDYYHHDKAAYDRSILLHRKLTKHLVFAGGGWTWNGIAPNYSKAEATLAEGLASCKEQQIEQVMCTFWFDNGMETPVRTAFYSALYFAQLCYNDKVNDEELNQWLVQLTGYRRADYFLLDAFDCTPGVKADNENADNPSKYLLYQDILVGLFDGQLAGVQKDMNGYYKELEEKLSHLASQNDTGEMGNMFRYYQVLAAALSKKAMLGIWIREAYQNGQKEVLTDLVQQIEDCIEQVECLKEQREVLWFSECRPNGFEVLDIRMGGVITRLQSAKKRIQKYVCGEIERIQELEEGMIIYQEDQKDKAHKLCAVPMWQDIVSAGNMAGI